MNLTLKPCKIKIQHLYERNNITVYCSSEPEITVLSRVRENFLAPLGILQQHEDMKAVGIIEPIMKRSDRKFADFFYDLNLKKVLYYDDPDFEGSIEHRCLTIYLRDSKRYKCSGLICECYGIHHNPPHIEIIYNKDNGSYNISSL
jgi:hypothetical protein